MISISHGAENRAVLALRGFGRPIGEIQAAEIPAGNIVDAETLTFESLAEL